MRPTQIAAVTGSRINVTCKAEGNPSPMVTWRKSYGVLRGNVKTTLVGTTLSISDVKKQDIGYYICSARNSVGTSSDIFILSVTGKLWTFSTQTRLPPGPSY